MNDPEQRWRKLAAAARRGGPGPDPGHAAPPPGFAARIVALRDVVIAFARTLLWRRWAVIAALLCGAALLAVLAATRCGGRPRPLIEPPAIVQPQP